MSSSGRAAAVERRRRHSSGGKQGIPASSAPVKSSGASASGREYAQARRAALAIGGKAEAATAAAETGAPEEKKDCGCGCKGEYASPSTRAPASVSVTDAPSAMGTGRLAAVVRRRAMSGRGKAGLDAQPKTGATLERELSPSMSGREVARRERSARSRNGGHGQAKSTPCGRTRPRLDAASGQHSNAAAPKVGVSSTAHGQAVTGSVLGRSARVTGDEASTCRNVTGTEYLGADQIEALCGSTPAPGPRKVGVTSTYSGRPVSGTEVGRGARVTGDEPGSCKHVTGSEYMSAEHFTSFCTSTPKASPMKVSVMSTYQGQRTTGTAMGRGSRVTGNEPGTCSAVTGTPYTGADALEDFCGGSRSERALARTSSEGRTGASRLTGTQPGLNGRVTGAARGACEAITGTPYVAAHQLPAHCEAHAAAPTAPADTPWSAFSVASPARAAMQRTPDASVTGTRYESGRITGPFDMAPGKVTGTEDFRHGDAPSPVPLRAAFAPPADNKRQRITGEGMDPNVRITGDDWNRGDRVTGTEGTSATQRNVTRRGARTSVMPSVVADARSSEEVPLPPSPVTGSTGSSERGARVTLSGGARG